VHTLHELSETDNYSGLDGWNRVNFGVKMRIYGHLLNTLNTMVFELQESSYKISWMDKRDT
jgi:hypothetical protein